MIYKYPQAAGDRTKQIFEKQCLPQMIYNTKDTKGAIILCKQRQTMPPPPQSTVKVILNYYSLHYQGVLISLFWEM